MANVPMDRHSRALSKPGELNIPALPRDYAFSSAAPPGQLAEYWQAIRQNIPLILAGATVGLLVGAILIAFQKPMYQTKTLLDIRSLNENFLSSGEGSPTGSNQSVLPESYIQTEIKILQSQSIRDRALASIPGVAAKKTTDTKPPSAFASLLPTPLPYLDVIADAGRRIKVRAAGNTRIVEISCDAQDGQAAATVCNALAQTYIANNLESRHESASDTSAWLQSQLEDARKRLNQGETLLKSVVGNNANYGDENPTQTRLHQLQSELSQSQSERWKKESTYQTVTVTDANSLPMEMDSGPIRQYRLQLNDLRQQRSRILSTKTPEHMEAKENALQIEEAEKALQRERDGMVQRLRSDLEMVLKRESLISAEYDKQADKATVLDDKAIRYNMIKRDVDSSRHLYETLLQRVGEVGIAAAMRTSTITIVDKATAPPAPYSPNRALDLGAGLFSGSLLAVMLSLVKMRTNHTIDSPGQTPVYLQLRELGVIPSMKNRGFRFQIRLPRSSPTSRSDIPQGANSASKGRGVLMPQMSGRSIALATWLRIPEMAEAVYGAMNSLLLTTEASKGGRVTVLTSPEMGDGKTTVAANLAVALAQVGRKVVLVDGDLRRPRLHTVFEQPAANGGLAALLSEDGPTGAAEILKFVQVTAVPGLSLLPTRPLREGVVRKLHSRQMRDLIDHLCEQFDEVVIDSPPMLMISDARVLGSMADGVLLVIRSRKTTRETALAAYDRLLQDGTRVFGTVLNGWERKAGEKYQNYAAYFRAAS